MGELSVQIFYLFVYILVICESVPLVSEEKIKDQIYKDDWQDNRIPDNLFSKTTEEQSGDGKESTPKLDKNLSILLTNISYGILEQFQKIAENVANVLKTSLLGIVKEIEEYNMPTIQVEHVINGDNRDVQNLSDTTNESDSSNLTKLDRDTSLFVRYWHDSMPQRSKVDHHSKLHRKYRRKRRKHRKKRSFFFDYGLGLDSLFGDDESDVIFGAHTSPCAHEDRYYCLNGGTCVFLGALEIKTCRCSIGYTGLRCEMINQEYILALLSDEFLG